MRFLFCVRYLLKYPGKSNIQKKGRVYSSWRAPFIMVRRHDNSQVIMVGGRHDNSQVMMVGGRSWLLTFSSRHRKQWLRTGSKVRLNNIKDCPQWHTSSTSLRFYNLPKYAPSGDQGFKPRSLHGKLSVSVSLLYMFFREIPPLRTFLIVHRYYLYAMWITGSSAELYSSS